MYTKSDLQRIYAKAKAARLLGGVAAFAIGVASTLLTMDATALLICVPLGIAMLATESEQEKCARKEYMEVER
jgi:hypothetical protein